MSFWKTLGKVLNPIPSVVKGIQGADSAGGVVNAIFNPAHSVINDVTGRGDQKLDERYRTATRVLENITPPNEIEDKLNALLAEKQAEIDKAGSESTPVYMWVALGIVGVAVVFKMMRK